MASITVGRFPHSDGADKALETLQHLRDQGVIQVFDGAVVTWPSGKKRPVTRPLVPPGVPGSLDQAFWGMLLGLLFFVPPEAANFDAAAGGLGGMFAQMGINAEFVNQARQGIREGNSAIFLFSEAPDPQPIADAAAGTGLEIVATTLPPERGAQLREMFGHN